MIDHDYTSEAVAFAQVLKLFVWVIHNRMDIVTNAMIAEDLGVSESTVVSAKNVLVKEYENVSQRKISQKLGDDCFRCVGQELVAGAWWNEL